MPVNSEAAGFEPFPPPPPPPEADLAIIVSKKDLLLGKILPLVDADIMLLFVCFENLKRSNKINIKLSTLLPNKSN